MGNTTSVGHIQNNKIIFLKDKYMKSFGNVKIYEVKHYNKQIVAIPCEMALNDPQKRIDVKHSNFINALAFEHQYKEVFGLSNSNLIYFFEYVDISLQQVLTQRQSQNSRFPEADIIRIATEILNCLAFLQQHDIAIGNIEPCTIFHDTSDNCIKMYDTSLILGEYPVYRMIKNCHQARVPYYTPEAIYAYKFKEEKVLEKFKFQSDIFSLGLTLLELCSFQDSMSLFDTDRKKINIKEIDERLSTIRPLYSLKIESLIRSMLTVDPRNRPLSQALLTQLHSSTVQPSITPTPFSSNNVSGLSQPLQVQSNNTSFQQISYRSNSSNQIFHRPNYHNRSVSPISPAISQRNSRVDNVSPLRLPTTAPSVQATPYHVKNHPSFSKQENSSNNTSFVENTNSNNQSFYNNNSSCLKQPTTHVQQQRSVSPSYVSQQKMLQQITQPKVRFDLRDKSPSQQYQHSQHPSMSNNGSQNGSFVNNGSFIVQPKSQNVSPIRTPIIPQTVIPVNQTIYNKVPSRSNLSFASILQNHQELVNNYQTVYSKGKEQSSVLNSNASEKDSENQQSRQSLADRTNYFSQKGNNTVSTPSPFAKNNHNNSLSQNVKSISNNSSFINQQQSPSYYFYQQQQINNENINHHPPPKTNNSQYHSSNPNNLSIKKFYQNAQNNDSSYMNENNLSQNQHVLSLQHQQQQQLLQQQQQQQQQFNHHLQQHYNQHHLNQIKSTSPSPSPVITKIIQPISNAIKNPIPKITIITSPQQRSVSPVLRTVKQSPLILPPSIQINPVIPSVITHYNSPIHQLNNFKIQPHIQSPQGPELINQQGQKYNEAYPQPSQFKVQDEIILERNKKHQDSLQAVINEETEYHSATSFSQPQQFIQKPQSQFQGNDRIDQYMERYTFNELESTPSNHSNQQQQANFNSNPEGNYYVMEEMNDHKSNKSNEDNQPKLNPSQYLDYGNFGKTDPELTAMASPTSQAIPQTIQFNNNQQYNTYNQGQMQANSSDDKYDSLANQSQQQYLNSNYGSQQQSSNLGSQNQYDSNNQSYLNDLKNQQLDSTVMRIQNKINQMGDLDERLQSLLQKNQKFSQNE